MVAENPPSNGDDRGPSLPPEPPNTEGHTPTLNLTFSESCEEFNQVLLQNTTAFKAELNTTINEFRYLLANNPSAMAIISHPPSPYSSNNTCANPTRAETSILPAGTSPPTSAFSHAPIISDYRDNSYSPKFSVLNHDRPLDPRFQSKTEQIHYFPPSPPYISPPNPTPTFRLYLTTGYPVFQCKYTGFYFTNQYPGGPLFQIDPPSPPPAASSLLPKHPTHRLRYPKPSSGRHVRRPAQKRFPASRPDQPSKHAPRPRSDRTIV